MKNATLCLWLALTCLITFETIAQQLREPAFQQDALKLLQQVVQLKSSDTGHHIETLKKQYDSSSDINQKAIVVRDITLHLSDISSVNELRLLASRANEIHTHNPALVQEYRFYEALAKASENYAIGEATLAQKNFSDAHQLVKNLPPYLKYFVTVLEAATSTDSTNVINRLLFITQETENLPNTVEGDKMRLVGYTILGYIYSTIGEIAPILRYYGQAAALAKQEKLPIERETLLYNIAAALNEAGYRDLAQDYYQGLQQVIEQTGRHEGHYYVHVGLADLSQQTGKWEDCIMHAQRALAIGADDPRYELKLYHLLAECNAQLGDPFAARSYQQRTADFLEQYPAFRTKDSKVRETITEALILAAERKYEYAFYLMSDVRDEVTRNQQEAFGKSIVGLQARLDTKRAQQKAEEALQSARLANNKLLIALVSLVAIIASAAVVKQRNRHNILLQEMHDADISNKAKSSFLANMSHELRTPLNSIIGFSEMMERGVYGKLGAPQYEEYITYIRSSGRHLLTILNDILDLSKIEADSLSLQEQNIYLNDLFDDVFHLMKQNATERNIQLNVSLEDNLPDLYADWRLLKQILLNLLSNAIKFTQPGGSITLSASKRRKSIYFAVEDTGIGMTAEEIEKALTPFGQASASLIRTQIGTGLGLPIVNNLAELHDAQFEIQSEKGLGTKVTLKFPSQRTSKTGPNEPADKDGDTDDWKI